MEKLLQEALRGKYRFNFKGSISTEDLWDLNLSELDVIYKGLKSLVKTVSEESLLKVAVKDEVLENKIAIVKSVFEIRQQEQNDRLAEKDKRERNQKIMEIIATKENNELNNKSLDELKAMLE